MGKRYDGYSLCWARSLLRVRRARRGVYYRGLDGLLSYGAIVSCKHPYCPAIAAKCCAVERPEEGLACFGWHEAEVPRKVREALVMDLVRRDHLSEAQAAALLHLDRWALLEVMGRYQIPAMRLSPEELKRELAQEIRRA